MKVIFKTLTGNKREVELEESCTVAQAKKHFDTEYDVGSLRLCFNGDVLADDKTFAELNIQDDSVVVLAGKKLKTVAKVPVTVSPAEVATTKQEEDADQDTKGVTSSASGSMTEPQPTAPSSLSGAHKTDSKTEASPEVMHASAAETGVSSGGTSPPSVSPAPLQPALQPAVDKAAIDNLVAMGFENRDDVALALRAAYMNVERAVEYLCSGIPPSVLREINESASATASAATAASRNPAVSRVTERDASAVDTPLRAALRAIPNFDDICFVAVTNPETMVTMMQQLADRYPETMNMVRDNPSEFLQIVHEMAADRSTGQPGQTLLPSGETRVQMTADDMAAVQRLVDIGGGMWDQRAAVVVYLACDKDEEMAVNVLFDNGGAPPELLQHVQSVRMAEEGE